jgi:hypothetical protein
VNSPPAVNAEHKSGSPSVIAELIVEIEQFVQARSDLFKTEIRQKLPHLRNAAGLGLAGGLLLITGYLFLAIAVVILIGSAFPENPYRWFFGFLIVGIVSVGFGAIGAFLAKSEFDLRSLLPPRTLKLLKGDKHWVNGQAEQK